ncbi:MAG: DUF5719 family protein [Promicromonosporaceae bacterium]|nr:DUF5719 family protein [Promicromonosporaceae bacterium]
MRPKHPGRLVGSALAVGVVAALAAVGAGPISRALPVPAVADDAVSVQVTPGPLTLICPPAPARPAGADLGYEQFAPQPGPLSGHLGAAGAGVLEAWLTDDGHRYDLPEAGGLAHWTAPPPTAGPVGVFSFQPAPAAGMHAAATFAAASPSGDLRGLAAAACVTPAATQWLLGGNTEVGSTAVLTIQNPGVQPAVVTLRAFGSMGPVVLGGQGQLLVPAGGYEQVLLEAIAPGQRFLAVEVNATGSRVGAHLQTQALEGLLPRGVDLLAPTAPPAEQSVIAGIVSGGEPLGDPHAPVLRLLAPPPAAEHRDGGVMQAPGAAEAGEVVTAELTLFGPAGRTVLPGAETVTLEPGVVTEVSLGGLTAGDYVAVINADAPVVAGAAFTRFGAEAEDSLITGRPTDVAWIGAQPLPAIGEAGQVALPGGLRARLVLTALPEGGETASEEPAGEAPAEGEAATAVIFAYPPGGAVAQVTELTLYPGIIESLYLPMAAGRQPLLLVVETAGGLPVTWALELTADDGSMEPERLISVVVPVRAQVASGVVRVREQTVGGSLVP